MMVADPDDGSVVVVVVVVVRWARRRRGWRLSYQVDGVGLHRQVVKLAVALVVLGEGLVVAERSGARAVDAEEDVRRLAVEVLSLSG
jgi:hypothetical protein